MKKHFPYQIHHIYLDNQQILPTLDTDGKGNYLVFWWKNIPLGHMFINPDEKLLEDDYHKKLTVTIRSAIEFYSQKQNLMVGTNWQRLLLDKKFKEWSDWMETVFSLWLPKITPQKVPVSVVICTRNRSVFLFQCLTLLKKLTCLPVEIVVVDNAPVDKASYDVVQQFDGVRYIKEPRIGLDIARNTGIKNSNCPIVAFVDDDVVVDPLWIFRVYETFLNPEIAAMTGLVIASQLNTEAQLIFERRWSFNRGYADKKYDAEFINETLHEGPPVWEIGAGANMAFRKSVFKEVGLFDELLDVGAAGCSGDSEMWYRILINGYSIIYNPRAVVHHEHRKEMLGLKKQIFLYMRGHTAAALLQHQQHSKTGYRRRIFLRLPIQYLRIIKKGFPNYQNRYPTLWMEIRGIVSGLAFYFKNRNNSTRSVKE